MPRYIVPAWLIVDAESPADALDITDRELRSVVQRWSEPLIAYDLPESDAAIVEEATEEATR
jgi:hypothetical protein